MSKEFLPYETLKEKTKSILPKEERQKLVEKYVDDYNNTKPSEALEYFNIIENEIPKTWGIITKEGRYMLDTIKQALIKAQELKSENSTLLEENKDLYIELTFANKQYKELIECIKQYKKVLEIIDEKSVDMVRLRCAEYDYQYNKDIYDEYHTDDILLTQEEFDLITKFFKKKG